MGSKIIFFTLRLWVGLPQNLGFDFSVYAANQSVDLLLAVISNSAILNTADKCLATVL